MSNNNIDFLKYKKAYELPHIWKLREEFLRLYMNKYEEDRLICLSNIFVNVEIMGLVYPSEVMNEIKELAGKVGGLEQFRKNLELNDQDEEEDRKRKHR